jgi:hypothetical protein
VVPPPTLRYQIDMGLDNNCSSSILNDSTYVYNNSTTDENAFKRFDIEWVSQRLWGGAARLTGGTHREGENGGKNEQKVHLGYLSL